MKLNRHDRQLIRFLRKTQMVSADAIAIAVKHRRRDPGPLPMILWQYGLISLNQLEQIIDWQGMQ